jgi:hypothetical protein
LAFHPYPQFIPAVFNPHEFGPPPPVTAASTRPRVDRHGFGSTPTYMRPIQTRFRFGSGPEGLNPHVSSNSPDHNAKGTQSDRPKAILLPLVGTWFQDLFHSPPGVLFTFPSRYSCTIGHRGVFRLGGWSPQIRAEFHVVRATRDTTRGRARIVTGLSPSLAGHSRPLHSGAVHPMLWSHNPRSASTPGLASSPFAHRYWGNLG